MTSPSGKLELELITCPPLQFLAQPGAANGTNHDFLPFSIVCHGPPRLLAAVESSQIAQCGL